MTPSESKESKTSKSSPAAVPVPSNGRPKFHVAGTVPRKKVTYELKETTVSLVADYARFLSNEGGYTVPPEAVLDRLSEELEKDRSFQDFLSGAGGRP